MANSSELFLRTIRTSSPREQEELWKNFLLRAYAHERVNILKQVLNFMDRQDPESLRKAIREYKEEREARLTPQGQDSLRSSNPSGSDPGRNDAPSSQRPAAGAQRPFVSPQRDAT
jgi:hypothetical protein